MFHLDFKCLTKIEKDILQPLVICLELLNYKDCA